MKSFILIALSILFSTTNLLATEKKKFKNIEEILSSKTIKFTVTGVGGHMGNCITIEAENTSPDTSFFRLEPGRRLVSVDTTEQDIFIVKEELVVLLPKEKKTINGFGFCCEATMHSPKAKSKFKIGFMEKKPWILLAEFFSKNKFNQTPMQNAVWVMSNNHAISSVIGDNEIETEKIRSKLAELLNLPVPWYSIRFEQNENQVFSGKHIRLTGPVEFMVREMAIITIQIRNANGEIVAIPLQANSYMNGEHVFALDIDIKDWPKGKYTIIVFQDGMRQVRKKDFEL